MTAQEIILYIIGFLNALCALHALEIASVLDRIDCPKTAAEHRMRAALLFLCILLTAYLIHTL